MRDPDRRERILGLIRDIWMRDENVDARLMQILSTALPFQEISYHSEDEWIERGLEQYDIPVLERK